MYKLILMKAEYEPWWQFEDMEEKFTDVKIYSTIEKYEQEASELLSKYRLLYKNEESKDGKYFAFWKEGDLMYCEGCDEDLQIYYGIIFSHPISSLVKSK